MAISDYNKIKDINVASASGAPTISKTQCLKISSGDDSTTGVGEIILDWTNISSKADIAIYDENNNLLDYYFESFDDTEETAVIWVYRDWVQDDTKQLRIVYGNGDSDQSVGASTVFDNETDLVAGYLFNESSGDLLDVTSNNNDGTVNGATQGEEGIVGDAYDFDGVDDWVGISHDSSMDFGTSNFTVIIWFKSSSFVSGSRIFSKGGESRCAVKVDELFVFIVDDSNIKTPLSLNVDGLDDDNWHMLIIQRDYGNQLKMKVDDGIFETTSDETGDISNTYDTQIAALEYYDTAHFGGKVDNLRVCFTLLSEDVLSALYSATKTTPDFFSQEAGVAGGNTTNFFQFF